MTDRYSPDQAVDLPLHPVLTCEQDPKILELPHLGQDLIRDPEWALRPFGGAGKKDFAAIYCHRQTITKLFKLASMIIGIIRFHES